MWKEWQKLGVHLVEDGWPLSTGLEAFTDSGTYAPTYLAGEWYDESGSLHLFICDGYAASAEAMQAASLAPMLGLKAFLTVFTSSFNLPYNRERNIMALDPDSDGFRDKLIDTVGESLTDDRVSEYVRMIRDGRDAGIPVDKSSIEADDFFPEKLWRVLAVSGYMCPDPYSGAAGVEEVADGVYRVAVRLAADKGDKEVTFTLRLMEDAKQSRLVFNPLLARFLYGEDYLTRAVKISDSGRIRNELQTLCVEALEFIGDEKIRIHFDRIPVEVITPQNQEKLKEILSWYKEKHSIWFAWLEIAE